MLSVLTCTLLAATPVPTPLHLYSESFIWLADETETEVIPMVSGFSNGVTRFTTVTPMMKTTKRTVAYRGIHKAALPGVQLYRALGDRDLEARYLAKAEARRVEQATKMTALTAAVAGVGALLGVLMTAGGGAAIVGAYYAYNQLPRGAKTSAELDQQLWAGTAVLLLGIAGLMAIPVGLSTGAWSALAGLLGGVASVDRWMAPLPDDDPEAHPLSPSERRRAVHAHNEKLRQRLNLTEEQVRQVAGQARQTIALGCDGRSPESRGRIAGSLRSRSSLLLMSLTDSSP